MPETSTAKQMPCWHFDAQPGVATLDMLAKRGRGVKIELADLRSQNVTSKADVKEAA